MTPSCVEWKLRLRTVQHESTVNMSDFAYQFLVNPKKILNKCVQKENLSYDTTISHCDFFNPLTPMSDQDRISPWQYQYNIEQKSDKNKEKHQLGDH